MRSLAKNPQPFLANLILLAADELAKIKKAP